MTSTRFWLCLVTALTGSVTGWAQRGALPNTTGAATNSPFLFARAPQAISSLGMLKRFNAYQPGTNRGIILLTLPFQADPVASEEAQLKAHAFSFTVSLDVDWHPLTATSRHAYFTYKRRPKSMLAAGTSLASNDVADVMEHWGATHALGGRLHCLPNATYSVEYTLFGPSATEMGHGRTGTNAFFDAVADTTVGALEALGYRVSPALDAHLRKPRARDPESLLDLGRAALAEERSGAEFQLYRDIIARDPEFGEVAYWAANQQYWVDDDFGRMESAIAQSMNHYVTMSAFKECPWRINPLKPDAPPPPVYNQIVGLVGAAHPTVVFADLRAAVGRTIPGDLLRRAKQAMVDNPDNFKLGMTLCDRLVSEYLTTDVALAGSLAESLLTSPAIPSNRATCSLLEKVASANYMTGYNDRALALLGALLSRANADASLDRLATSSLRYVYACLAQMGRYGDAATVGVELIRRKVLNDPIIVGTVATCALLGDRQDLLPEISNALDAKQGVWSYDTFLLAQNLLTNGPLPELPQDAMNWRAQGLMEQDTDVAPGLKVLMLQELARRHGQEQPAIEFLSAVRDAPTTRAFWVMLDQLDRAHPGKLQLGPFYEAIHWLHADDAWVRSAYLEYVSRGGQQLGAPIERHRIEAWYAQFPVLEWPIYGNAPKTIYATMGREKPESIPIFSGVWLVKTLLSEHRYQEARAICLRSLAWDCYPTKPRAKAMDFDLLYLVDEAERRNCGDNIPCLLPLPMLAQE
ncbi:MAG: hypothetical protein K8T26_01115 [Lentisphaerae bacterium]|nr:hypothetical protein [Lentisphaerota bacterium]